MIALMVHAALAATTQVQASLTLRVDDRGAASETAVELAEEAGGWFSSLSGEHVALRVPVADVEGVLESLREVGDVVERTYGASDLSDEVIDLEGRLAARRTGLDQYLEVLETARPEAVVAVESEVARLIAEIEQIEGRLRVLRDRADYAQVDVSFRYRERRAPLRDGSSSFAWLNSLNVQDLLDDFEYGDRATRSRVKAVAPAGFAPFRRAWRFQAVSPDEVVYRVRSAKNKPKAELGFWQEALKTRMVDAGYHLENEQAVKAGAAEGYLLELGAANGEQDQAYVVALFVKGRKLILVEATGEAETFAGRRDDVVAAIEALGF